MFQHLWLTGAAALALILCLADAAMAQRIITHEGKKYRITKNGMVEPLSESDQSPNPWWQSQHPQPGWQGTYPSWQGTYPSW